MGLTCASLHVLLPDSPAASVAPLLDSALGPLGYERIDSPDESERRFIAASAPPWVSLFDLTGPPAMTEELIDLGKRLSAAARSPVLLTSVVDSDAFAFLVFDAGKQVDGHASARGLIPGRVKKWPPERRAQEWSRLFGRPIDRDDLQALTEKGVLFAEDLLARLCGVVGLSRELAMCTPGDLQAQRWPNQEEFSFRSRPGSGGGFAVKQTVTDKKPRHSLTIHLGGEKSIP